MNQSMWDVNGVKQISDKGDGKGNIKVEFYEKANSFRGKQH